MDETVPDVLKGHGGSQFSAFKSALIDVAVAKLAPIGSEMRRLVSDPAHIDAVLAEGSARARTLARPTMDAVKDIVGFVRAG
jgi:tryptophanyl-tRNA synthetase